MRIIKKKLVYCFIPLTIASIFLFPYLLSKNASEKSYWYPLNLQCAVSISYFHKAFWLSLDSRLVQPLLNREHIPLVSYRLSFINYINVLIHTDDEIKQSIDKWSPIFLQNYTSYEVGYSVKSWEVVLFYSWEISNEDFTLALNLALSLL